MQTANEKDSVYHGRDRRTAVVLVNLGTPKSPGYFDVLFYLREFLSDPRVVGLPRLLWYPILYGFILPFRSRASGEKYSQIFDKKRGMPLLYLSKDVCSHLQDSFASTHPSVDIYLAMRYGKPSLEDVLGQIKQTPVREILFIPMFPQYSQATTATIVDKVARIFKKWRFVPDIRFLSGFADHPKYISALSASIKNYWQKHGRGEKLLISFHGLPKRSLRDGDPYFCLCHKTTRLLTQTLDIGPDDFLMVFQSRLGPFPWLSPYTEDTIVSLAKSGYKTLDIVAPGFSVDCLETIDEIGREYQELFQEHGGTSLRYIPALNDSPAAIDCFRSLICAHIE